jgi:chromosome segregation ATPase
MSLFGKKGEELGRIAELLTELINKMEGMEGKLAEIIEPLKVEIVRSIKSDIEAIKETQPSELLTEFKEAIRTLKLSVSTIQALQEHESSLKEILEFQNSQVEQLEQVRRSIAAEREALKEEKERLEELKRQIEMWKQELGKKEAILANYEQDVRMLEERKEELERKVKELNEQYIALIEQTNNRLEKAFRDLDRRFKIREIRLDRL